MSELALRQDNIVQQQPDPTGGRLVAWAEAAHAANQLARALSQTSFVPAAFKGNVNDATAAILMGDEIGLSPLASLRSIYVVHGTPAMYARTMVALALSHGHRMWTEKSTDTEVVVCGQRKGNEHVERSVWTSARATKAGYASNKKYATNGAEMLYSKAAAEIARKIAADVLAGIGATVEDLELDEPEPTTTITRGTQPLRTVRRAPRLEPAEPPLDEEPTAHAPEQPATEPEPPAETQLPRADVTNAVELITPKQLTALHTLFGLKGFHDRVDCLDYVRNERHIDVQSSKDLSKAEASDIIDALTQLDDVVKP